MLVPLSLHWSSSSSSSGITGTVSSVTTSAYMSSSSEEKGEKQCKTTQSPGKWTETPYTTLTRKNNNACKQRSTRMQTVSSEPEHKESSTSNCVINFSLYVLFCHIFLSHVISLV